MELILGAGLSLLFFVNIALLGRNMRLLQQIQLERAMRPPVKGTKLRLVDTLPEEMDAGAPPRRLISEE